MTKAAQWLVFRVFDTDATPEDVERWAAERGCIVANVRQVPDGIAVDYEGKTLVSAEGERVWTAEIVVEEGIR